MQWATISIQKTKQMQVWNCTTQTWVLTGLPKWSTEIIYVAELKNRMISADSNLNHHSSLFVSNASI